MQITIPTPSARAAALFLAAAAYGAEAGAAQCSVDAVPVAFGAFSPIEDTPGLGVGEVTVSCDGTPGESISYEVSMDGGGGSSFYPRTMAAGGQALHYNLYSDAARTAVWGDGTGGTGTVQGGMTLTGGQGSNAHSIYGKIPTGQTPSVGAYSDTVGITVNY